VSWHTFHHTYRALLGDTNAPGVVQQKLMRHADITTTMKYGNAYMPSKRAALSKVEKTVIIFSLPSPLIHQRHSPFVRLHLFKNCNIDKHSRAAYGLHDRLRAHLFVRSIRREQSRAPH
jgi:hypothetical protein